MNRTELEDGLKKIPGVSGIKVVGDDQPTEIHVVASHDRAPKQLVRDIQSLAAAGFGLAIDHRIVSIVQLEDVAAQATGNGNGSGRVPRILLERIEVSKGSGSDFVKVVLRHPSGEVTEGSCTGGGSRVARGKAAVIAALRALDPLLASRDASVDLEHLSIQHIDVEANVLLRAVFYERGVGLSLVGTAVIEDDVATAAIKALLQALNRKLQ